MPVIQFRKYAYLVWQDSNTPDGSTDMFFARQSVVLITKRVVVHVRSGVSG